MLPPYCSPVPPRVSQYSHHIVRSAAMRTPVPPVHSPQHRHASPMAPTITSPVPPRVPQFIHHIVLCTAMLPLVPPPHCLQHHHTPSSIPTLPFSGPSSSPHTPPRRSRGQGTPPYPYRSPSWGHGQAQRPFGCTRRRSPPVFHPIHFNAGVVAAPRAVGLAEPPYSRPPRRGLWGTTTVLQPSE